LYTYARVNTKNSFNTQFITFNTDKTHTCYFAKKIAVSKNKKGKKNISEKHLKQAKLAISVIVKALGNDAYLNKLFPLLEEEFSQELLHAALKELEAKGKLAIKPKGKLEIPVEQEVFSEREKHKPNTYRGTLDLLKSGAGYVIIEGRDQDVFIPPRFINGANHGDEVLVALAPGHKRKPEGKIVEIAKRSQESFVGTLFIHRTHAFVQPEGQRASFNIIIPLEKTTGFEAGKKVIARIVDWNGSGKHPVGEIVEIVAGITEADTEMKLILVQNGFHIGFPKNVLHEARSIPQTVPQKEIDKRLDMRDVLTFTIDPVDAKDFDDAISYRELENGHIEIGVHIADVSHYVLEGSAMDKEAEQRATSVYLPDRVCPMLPEEISNIICSLRPNEDKLTFSTIFEFTRNCEMKNVTIAKTVIHSNRRFTYEQAQEILEKKQGEYADELLMVHKIANHIRKKRFGKGAIAFEKDEVRFRLDENGKPLELYVKHRKESNLLIEDLMLLSNETIARFGSKVMKERKKYPFVYRVHDKPDAGKLAQFATVAARFGYQIAFDEDDPKQISATLNTMLQKVAGRPEQNLLEQMAIRSMAKATYTTKNIGHYGLAMEFYTHFTSPIRRYPDVLVHRLVHELLTNQAVSIEVDDLEARCKISSQMERKAMDAEREAIRYKQVEYLLDKIGNEYEGIITGVIARGIFVEMKGLLCEGMANTDRMGDDDFVFDEVQIMLKGRKTGKKYTLGQPVHVRVVDATLATRKIDLELITEDER
jgi:ribonuclease R